MPNQRNLDELRKVAMEMAKPVAEAAGSEDQAYFAEAMADFAQNLQRNILSEARELSGNQDASILAARGVRQLTAAEKQYYEGLATAMRSGNPMQAVSDMELVLPETTIDMVFSDLTQKHPLLDVVNFTNTGALAEWILSSSGGVAGWGELTGTIKDELSGGFEIVKLSLNKLSAFFPVNNAMLDLGPAWLDRYVRAILAESLAVGLEEAIVDGNGKDKPIGMTRALAGAVDGVHPRKDAITVNALDPITVGGILETVSKGRNDKRRAVPQLLMVVNPADYYTKVYPATTIRTASGGYANDALPYPIRVVVSSAMPSGYAVFGLAEKYFFGLGTSKGGKLEYSNEYQFLEDRRVYRIKMYGNGRPTDDNAFVYADISALKPALMRVEVVGEIPEV